MVATAISRPRRQFNPFGGYGGGFPGMGMQQPPSQQNQQSSNQVGKFFAQNLLI
jgi:hypothetical protein